MTESLNKAVSHERPPEWKLVFEKAESTGHDKNVNVFARLLVPVVLSEKALSIISQGESGKLPNILEKIQIARAIQNCRERLGASDSSTVYTGFEILFPEKMSMEERIRKEAELGLMLERRIKGVNKEGRTIMERTGGRSPFVLNRILNGEEVVDSTAVKMVTVSSKMVIPTTRNSDAVNVDAVRVGMEYLYSVYQEVGARIIALDYSQAAHHAHQHRIQHPSDVSLEKVSDSLLTAEEKRGIAIMKGLARFADTRIIGIIAFLEDVRQAEKEVAIKEYPPKPLSDEEKAALKTRLDALKKETDDAFKKRNIMQELKDKYHGRRVWD